jgi:3-oxoacyl-[acyl-carrier protein] reductase/bacilysin biosynthesis oxidoreductase BacG
MELGLRGRTAIVTGASQGIGLEIARALHAEGVTVVMVAQSTGKLREAAQTVASAESADASASAIPLVADLTLRAEIERVVAESIKRLGHVDILVNNAARAHSGNFFKMSVDDLESVWQVKGLGYVRLVRMIAPHMMERRSGSIINVIGSTARVPTSDFIVGSMVNAALVNFTRGIARELAQAGVRINAISPGWTMTERQEKSIALQAAARNLTFEQVEREEARGIPLRRLVRMSEIAALTLLLAANVFPSVTGEDIVVDGGAVPAI